jgi:Tfp pilus assembly protein PilX
MAVQTEVMSRSKNGQQGIALMFCLIALLILTAITTSLVLMSTTDTVVNANYRSEETAFFAAKTGVYEALDRMQQSNASSIASSLPTSTSNVFYLINAGNSLTVQPWTLTNTYYDDELCHEGITIASWPTTAQILPPDVPCTSLPSGTTWYTSTTSNYPWSGTSTAIPYEWVRITWKQNSSETYVSGTGTSAASANYSVNSSKPAATPVCWNGGSEVLLSTPTGVTPAYTNCEQYQTCAAASPVITTPVFMVTSLSVTSNGSRHMVQAEAALTPPSVTVSPCGISDPYGFFAYGGTCAAPGLTIAGNASVDGYNSANGTYAATHLASLGSVGTNGGAVAQGTSTHIGGTVYVPNIGAGSPPGPGVCPDDFHITGSPTYGGLATSTVLTPPTVTIPPNPSSTDESAGHNVNLVLVPGNYRNVSVGSGGTITLTAPGTYNIDCITASGAGSNIAISPANKAITINISGTGCTSAPINFGSNTFINNSSGVAANFMINYAGTGTLTFTGGTSMYTVVNAPNAAVVLHGGADYYGTIMASTIDDSGGTNLHFDAADTTISGATAATATANATGSYNTLAFRSVPY